MTRGIQKCIFSTGEGLSELRFLKIGAAPDHKWIIPDDGGGGDHRNMSDFMNTFPCF
jgi:hypothetical protein